MRGEILNSNSKLHHAVIRSSSIRLDRFLAALKYVLHLPRHIMCSLKRRSHTVQLHRTHIAEELNGVLGVDVLEHSDQLFFAQLEDVLHDTFHLGDLLEFICAVVEEKCCHLEIIVGDFFRENLLKLSLYGLNLVEVFVVEPLRHLHLALVSLLKVDGKPEGHSCGFGRPEWPKSAANEIESIFFEVWHDLH